MSSSTFELNTEMVRAGAGAGKTTALTEKVMDLAIGFRSVEKRFPKIVVTTFTRKATQELKERLMVKAIESNDQELLNFTTSNSQLNVSTIHGVLSIFLKRYGHLMGIDPGFALLSELEAQTLAKKTFKKIMDKNEKVLEALNIWDVQTLVQLMRQYHEIMMINDKCYFIDPVSNDQIEKLIRSDLCDIFELINQVSKSSLSKGWITYIANLESQIVPVIEDSNYSLWMDFVDSFEFSRKPPFKLDSPPFDIDTKNQLDELLENLKKNITEIKLIILQKEKILGYQKLFQDVANEFHNEFSETKMSQSQYEMSDLELMTLKWIKSYPHVAQLFSDDWDYWLIDEFQDTSPIQIQLLNHFIQNENKYMVGDPQQSIYLFRGARSEVFYNEWNKVEEISGKLSLKQINYRSNPSLLLFFNDFFTKMDKQFTAMSPKDGELNLKNPVIKICIANEFEDIESPENSELNAISNHINNLVKTGVKLDEICVLSRTNQQLERIAKYLKQQGYSVHLHSASGFYKRREVKDILSLLKFLINPHDNSNLLSILRSPFFNISDKKLELILKDKPLSLWTELKEKYNSLNSVDKLMKYLECINKIGVSKTLRRIIIDEGIIDISQYYDITGRREANIWKTIHIIEEQLSRPGFNYPNLDKITIKLNSEDSSEEQTDAVSTLEPNCINLMTVHSSKGLQFNHVIIPKCSHISKSRGAKLLDRDELSGELGIGYKDDELGKRITPCLNIIVKNEISKRELEESQRLLYVAMTRAKESVFISYSGDVKSNTWASYFKPWVQKVGIQKYKNYLIQVENGPWINSQNIQIENGKKELKAKLNLEKVEYQKSQSRISTTDLLNSNFSIDSIKSRSFQSNQSSVDLIQKGILLHRCLEILNTDWDFDLNPILTQWFQSDELNQVVKAIQFVKNCDTPPMETLIKGGNVEWGFQKNMGSFVLEGQIDLWGLDNNGVLWIVDYKSGSEKYLDKAFQQLSIYSLALVKNRSVENVKLAVIFPFSQTVHVKDLPSENNFNILIRTCGKFV